MSQIVNNSKRKKTIRNITAVILVILVMLLISAFLISRIIRHRVNQEFEEYSKTVTMKDEYIQGEIEILNSYADNMLLSNVNRGNACNVISIMYGIENKRYESILYMCKAMRFYQKENENAGIIHTAVNLSSTLIAGTSYDVAESILYASLDEKFEKEEEDIYHLFIYTNLAGSMAQRGKYDQALEVVQIAESLIEKDSIPEDETCILSIKLSKALALQGLGRTRECKEILKNIEIEKMENNALNLLNYAIPYYEVQSYVKLSEGNEKEARKFFNKYVSCCDKYSYNSMKLEYFDKFSKEAKQYGLENEPFIRKFDEKLLDYYREELKSTNNESAKILLDTYATSVENVFIRSKQRSYRLKVYGGSVVFVTILAISVVVAIRIRKKSQQDFLTGAYNRGKLRMVYKALVRRKQSFYVIMFDIDDFKMCNDEYGHQFGDCVLERIAYGVNQILPKECNFCRYGGEEFVVIGDLKSNEEALTLAEEIRKCVESLEWENGIHITISIGVASSEGSKEPISQADECLYQSKKSGKNKVTCKF